MEGYLFPTDKDAKIISLVFNCRNGQPTQLLIPHRCVEINSSFQIVCVKLNKFNFCREKAQKFPWSVGNCIIDRIHK